MHDTAFEIGRLFFQTYFDAAPDLVLEVGSQNVNGTLRNCAPAGSTYIGVDITAGNGVDIVLTNPHTLPFVADYFDAVVSSSCLEHDQMFWVTFLEILRVTKPGGYVYLNAPSNGSYHSYPYDNWRFYPDAGIALLAWARHRGVTASLMESFIARRKADVWNDCVLVFRKSAEAGEITRRIADQVTNAYNIRRGEDGTPANFSVATEDMLLVHAARQQLAAKDQEIARLNATVQSSEAALAGLTALISSISEPRFAALAGTIEELRAGRATDAGRLMALERQLQAATDALAAQLRPLGERIAATAAAIEDLRRTTEERLPAASQDGSE
ncbi:MAG TPA: methyltransferase domain-containing protein [Stellaceae bacterium]|jgi:SAM-dependent methyltransferase|nr:methyltransferase domain-containing protein [Stellaceae bacterium]